MNQLFRAIIRGRDFRVELLNTDRWSKNSVLVKKFHNKLPYSITHTHNKYIHRTAKLRCERERLKKSHEQHHEGILKRRRENES